MLAWQADRAAAGESPTFDETSHLVSGFSYWQARDFRLTPESGAFPQLWAGLPLWLGGVFATALASVFIFFKRYVEETGIGSVGDFFSAYAVTAIGLRLLLGWLPDRVGPKRVLLPALAALVTAFALLSEARSAGDVLLAGVLFGLGHGFTFPILFGILVTRAGEADRGSAMAIFTALFDTGVLLGGPVFGALITWVGFSSMYLCAAVGLAVGVGVFAAWDRER